MNEITLRDQLITAGLDDSWLKFVGTRLRFERLEGFCEPSGTDMFAAIPVKRGQRESGLIAVRVSLETLDQLTASLFGISLAEIDAEQRTDVCGELCNILGSVARIEFGSHEDTELGTPRMMSNAEFRDAMRTNPDSRVFEAYPDRSTVTVATLPSH